MTWMIYVIVVALLGAARRRTTRRRRRINPQTFRGVQISPSGGLGTLANKSVTTIALSNAVNDTVLITSAKVSIVWDDATDADGPLMVGFAHSDYTDAEIEEFIESIGEVDFGDKISAERSRRLIRLVGTLHAPESVRLPMKKTKLNWLLAEGDFIQLFVYNTGAVLTTGSEMITMGQLNLFLK